jgi:uncharacterized membrane protein YgcG
MKCMILLSCLLFLVFTFCTDAFVLIVPSHPPHPTSTTTTILWLHPGQGAELEACADAFLQRESTLKATQFASRRRSLHVNHNDVVSSGMMNAPVRTRTGGMSSISSGGSGGGSSGGTSLRNPVAWCRRMISSGNRRRPGNTSPSL